MFSESTIRPSDENRLSTTAPRKKYEEWLNIFIDLVFISGIFHISNLMNSCFISDGRNIEVFIVSCAYLWLLFLTRYHFDYCADKLMNNTYGDRILTIFYGLAIFTMSYSILFIQRIIPISATDDNIQPTPQPTFAPTESNGFYYYFDNTHIDSTYIIYRNDFGSCFFQKNAVINFFLGFVLSRIIILCIYYRKYISNRNEIYTNLKIKSIFIILSGFIAFSMAKRNAGIIVYPIIVTVDVLHIALADNIAKFYYYLKTKKHLKITSYLKQNIKNKQDRLCLFFMLILGHNIITLTFTLQNNYIGKNNYVTLYVPFTL
jgi:hypothetical protein